jgi:hypothetical protein
LVKKKAGVVDGPDEGRHGKDSIMALASAQRQSSKIPLIECRETHIPK